MRWTTERTADYVILGAGTAGCVVAARLSEDPSAEVLLLEAGGTDRRPDVMIPGLSSALHRSSADWGFWTAPQEALGGRQVYCPRGKVLGGSGSTNTLIVMRGHPRDFDEWAEAGAEGWAWRDVLPAFVKSERYLAGAAGPLHGAEGPLDVRKPDIMHPLWQAFLDAAGTLGIPRNDDFNGASMDGVGLYDVHVRGGLRLSTARAYLRPALGRRNLTLLSGAHARELIFEGRRCVGVMLRRGMKIEAVRARREVILCAGAIGSPHLLLSSGVGPEDHLGALGRAVVHALPGVGEGLQEHPLLPLSDLCRERITLNTSGLGLPTALEYLTRRSGLLAWPMPAAGGFLRTAEGLDRPDVQLHFVAAWARDIHDFHGRAAEDGYSVTVTLSRPRSRGRLRLGSARPEAPPIIDPAMLTHPDDLAPMVRGFRRAQEILEAAPFDRYRLRPAKPARRLAGDEEIVQYLRTHLETNYHPTCTCRMGGDEMAVVDPALRVRGLEGLRVIDASVMPSITTGNTNAPAIMIAERGAEMIRRGVG